MEKKVQRCSTFNGISFETKDPKINSLSIQTPALDEFRGSKRAWFPWGSFSAVSPTRDFSGTTVTLSRTSNHFCDVHFDEDEDSSEDLEVPNSGLPPATSIRQPSRNEPSKTKKGSRLSVILLDQGLFTVYKRLFVACLTVNITALVLAICGEFPYARNKAALFSIANIFALTLCRSEVFLRAVFWLAVKVLGHSWVPIRVKTMATSFLQSLGGIHSSFGLSSIAWLVYALVLTLKDRENASPMIIGIASVNLTLLFLSSLAAFPLVRHLHHNVFERTHRLAGWTSLVLLWAFVFLKISYDPKTKSYTNGLLSHLIKQQEFWFTVANTTLVIIPWITVRKVPVKVSSASGHASIIKFQGGVRAGLLGRISRSPLSEWHAFGIISDRKKDHMMLAGAVGDFTRSLVSIPPSHLWVRGVHFAGLPYLVNMYDRVLLVATGSGICVFLSFLLQPCLAKVCVLWVTKGVEQNFGVEIKEMMSGHPEDKVIIHDTALLGRPNVAQMSVVAAKKWDAQVVLVTSNPEGSRDIVNACKADGIPAFGPIWDS